MKYTNYLVNKEFINVDQLISKNKILKPVTVLIAITVAIFALTVVTGAIPAAMAADSTRFVRYQYWIFAKKYRKYRYYDYVFDSLSVPSPAKVKMYYALKDISYYDTVMSKKLILTPELLLHKSVNNLNYIRKKLTIF